MSRKISFHLAGWLLYFFLRNGEEIWEEPQDWADWLLNLSYLLVSAATFYGLYSLALPRFLQAGRQIWLVPCLLGAFLFFPALRFLVEETLFPLLFGFSNYHDPQPIPYFLDNYWRAFLPVGAALTLYAIESQIRHEREKLQLQREQAEAELSFLRAQLNPHFLFNALHYLHTEAYKAGLPLADTVLQLSDLLRASLKSAQAESIRVQEEIDLLENYLAIQQKRFQGRCFVEFEKKGGDFSKKIEPLLLIPFVENAFKHGDLKEEAHPLQIKLSLQKGVLHFSCRNRIRKGPHDHSSGIGIANIRRRLQLKYPQRHDLEIVEKGDIFQVHLKLQL